ncbi:hypothetical protein TURU_067737 [Turdus rufiventris]|nr:hypothetical protein TURU_067737 [Turdus rufiventris]
MEMMEITKWKQWEAPQVIEEEILTIQDLTPQGVFPHPKVWKPSEETVIKHTSHKADSAHLKPKLQNQKSVIQCKAKIMGCGIASKLYDDYDTNHRIIYIGKVLKDRKVQP